MNGHGIKTYKLTDEKYDGFWKNNLRNGKGTYIYKNGDKLECEWKDDKIIGTVNYTY